MLFFPVRNDGRVAAAQIAPAALLLLLTGTWELGIILYYPCEGFGQGAQVFDLDSGGPVLSGP